MLLHTMVHEGNVIRGLQVEKMRGIAHDTQLRPYQITQSGVEVFPEGQGILRNLASGGSKCTTR